MMTMDNASHYFQLAFSVACTILQYLRDGILSILEVNYEVVSKTIMYCSIILDIVVKILNVTSSVLFNILSALVDFLMECSNFFNAFLTMIWKLSLLLISFLNLVFRCLEQIFYCFWSGGAWTLGTLQSSWMNFKFTSINLYEYTSTFIYSAFFSIYGALSLVGSLTIKVLVSAFYGAKFTVIAAWELIDDIMNVFDWTVRYITNNVYYFLTKFIPGLSKEAYLGVLVCCITYFFVVNLYNMLSSRGMTFPIFNRPHRHGNQNGRHRNYGFGNEFSDDEVEMSDNENGESDAETYISDEDDDLEDVDDENIDSDDEDDDNSDDESENDESSSGESDVTTNSNDIDIRLPPVDERYNLRRSVTPSRSKDHNPRELAKAVEHEREKQKCVVCQDENKSVLILPCRHMCLCVTCGNKIARARNVDRRVCPLCRQRIRTIMNVYV